MKENTKRYSRLDSYYDSSWMQSKFELTPEGYLTGRAIVTNIGVFTYRNADGSVRRELRLPEEVFRESSLETLKKKPLTNDHPSERVVADNVKELSVGFSGSEVTSNHTEYDWNGKYNNKVHDGIHVAVDLTITDADAVKQVLEGKVGLSCGYDCTLDEAPLGATYLGMEYDYIQRDITYNHIALVKKGRAGDNAKIRLDSADAVLVENIKEEKGGNNSMADFKKLNLDGVDYEAEARVIEKYTELSKRADALNSEITQLKENLSKLEAEKDSATDRADKAEQEAKKLKEDSADASKINSLVSEKLSVIEVAKEAGAEFNMDSEIIDIKKAVIMKVAPKANLDGKDEVYVSARFDSILEQIKEETENSKEQKAVLGSTPASVNHSDSASEVEESRKAYIARLKGEVQ